MGNLQVHFFANMPKTATGKVQRQMVASAVLAREIKTSTNTVIPFNSFGGMKEHMIRVAQGMLRSLGNWLKTLKALPWMIKTRIKRHLKTA